MVIEKVRDTIEKHQLIKRGDKVIVALSGGPDSVCLLHVLCRLREEYNLKIYAVHLNHRLRGLDAHKDALYVSDLCNKLSVSCFIKAIDVDGYCKDKKLSVEEGARELRYKLFDDLLIRLDADKVCIGHNKNDQAETVLMRIMRGTGINGLKGIAHKRSNTIVRPILDISRSEIEDYCKQYDLKPRIDKTNLESIYTRNKIRLELLPYIEEEFNQNIVETLARMAEGIGKDADFINRLADEEFAKLVTWKDESIILDINGVNNLDISLKSRMIIKAISDLLTGFKNIDMNHINQVLALCKQDKSGKMLNLPNSLFVYRSGENLIFSKTRPYTADIDFEYPLKKPENNIFKEIVIDEIGIKVSYSLVSRDEFEKNKSKKNYKFINYDKVEGDLLVRNKKAGDKIKLRVGSKKIKDLLIDLKVPRELRSEVFLICDSKDLILADLYRISENYKIDNNTKEILGIKIDRI